MTTPREIVDALGRENIAATLGKTPAAVAMALGRGPLPSAWFDAIESMCIEKGISCPRSAFGFQKPVHATKRGNAPASRQGEVSK